MNGTIVVKKMIIGHNVLINFHYNSWFVIEIVELSNYIILNRNTSGYIDLLVSSRKVNLRHLFHTTLLSPSDQHFSTNKALKKLNKPENKPESKRKKLNVPKATRKFYHPQSYQMQTW